MPIRIQDTSGTITHTDREKWKPPFVHASRYKRRKPCGIAISPWAVKKAKKGHACKSVIDRLKGQGVLLRSLDHPNIIAFKKLTQTDKGWFFSIFGSCFYIILRLRGHVFVCLVMTLSIQIVHDQKTQYAVHLSLCIRSNLKICFPYFYMMHPVYLCFPCLRFIISNSSWRLFSNDGPLCTVDHANEK